MEKTKLLLIVLFTILITTPSFGHWGEHQYSENIQSRKWYLENKSFAAEGSLLLLKDDQVFIENLNGEILSFPLASLSWVDKKYVQRKYKEIQNINHSLLSRQTNKTTNLNSLLIIFIYIAGVTFIFLIRRKLFQLFNLRNYKTSVNGACIIGCLLIGVACENESDDLDSIIELLKTDPAFIQAAFAPYENVTTNYDDNYFYVASNGIPDHQMMVNITAWIAQVPLPQPYTGNNSSSIPLNPEYAENPISIETDFQRGAIAIAANGIPIFNPINASGFISKEIGELDDFGGHSGRADDYHYHTAPLHLEATSGNNPIAFAFDGFAVYGSLEPDGSPMETLDQYHGHIGNDNVYHYHGTENYPYMIGAMRGVVNLDPNEVSPYAQIIPQANTQPLRGNPHPINGDNLIITSLTEKEAKNGYVLEYTIEGVPGSVDYSWDDNDFYTFIFHDVDGSTSTQTFQK